VTHISPPFPTPRRLRQWFDFRSKNKTDILQNNSSYLHSLRVLHRDADRLKDMRQKVHETWTAMARQRQLEYRMESSLAEVNRKLDMVLSQSGGLRETQRGPLFGGRDASVRYESQSQMPAYTHRLSL
jgi:hypothetical protein